VGRTPAHIVAIRPLVEGVISDFEITEEMMKYFIGKVQERRFGLLARPRVVVGIPSSTTEVERRAVRDAAISAGAREVYLVEEPMAAAVGIRMPIQEPVGNMVVDIGGGTTDIAVISLGGIVASRNIKVAGDRLNEDIIQFARDEFKILIGERTAEDIKIAIGSAWEGDDDAETTMRGRDLITGLPREVIITSNDARDALDRSVKMIVTSIKEVIEDTPPELISDIMHRGIILVGGGALLRGLDHVIEKSTKMPVRLSDEPLTAVVRGTGVILEDLDNLREVLLDHEREVVPQ
jgi:rod shape-determining protein MreB and related proteins